MPDGPLTHPHPDLTARVETFLGRVQAMAPDAVSEVILTGSGALGDWWPGVSDIDLVYVLSRPLVAYELDWLAALHRSTVEGGAIDGLYLTRPQLMAGPEAVREAPQVVEGVLHPSAALKQLTWVTWREIEQGLRSQLTPPQGQGQGQPRPLSWEPSPYTFPGLDTKVRAACRQNLLDYWKPLGKRSRTYLSIRRKATPVDPEMVPWLALGPPRLLATIESGEVISKSAAGSFAAERWPDLQDVLLRAVAARRGMTEVFTKADALVALQVLDRCLAAAPGDAPSRGRRLEH